MHRAARPRVFRRQFPGKPKDNGEKQDQGTEEIEAFDLSSYKKNIRSSPTPSQIHTKPPIESECGDRVQ
jgi:hypothetical protein